MGREQVTPEPDVITDRDFRDLSFICPYALLSKEVFLFFQK